MINPIEDKKGSVRVYRGGSWFSLPFYVRASYRDFDDPTSRYDGLGFRIVRNKA